MLCNHPTITSLSEYLAKRLLPQEDSEGGIEIQPGSTRSDSHQHREQDVIGTALSRIADMTDQQPADLAHGCAESWGSGADSTEVWAG